jgi:hypothetical protein
MLSVITPNKERTRSSRWPVFSRASTVLAKVGASELLAMRQHLAALLVDPELDRPGEQLRLHLVPGRNAVIGAGPVGEQDVVRDGGGGRLGHGHVGILVHGHIGSPAGGCAAREGQGGGAAEKKGFQGAFSGSSGELRFIIRYRSKP